MTMLKQLLQIRHQIVLDLDVETALIELRSNPKLRQFDGRFSPEEHREIILIALHKLRCVVNNIPQDKRMESYAFLVKRECTNIIGIPIDDPLFQDLKYH